MSNIKRIIVSILLIMCLMFTLTGCAKCISTEYENVEVNIVDEYHKPSYTTIEYNISLKMPMSKSHPAVYRITVEYNGVEYTISGSSTYNKYKDMVGQTTTGTLEIRTYDDGSVRYDITSLE